MWWWRWYRWCGRSKFLFFFRHIGWNVNKERSRQVAFASVWHHGKNVGAWFTRLGQLEYSIDDASAIGSGKHSLLCCNLLTGFNLVKASHRKRDGWVGRIYA